MSEPTEMELRVATAIADSIGGNADVWLASAKAAIRCMRVPTMEMVRVALVTPLTGDESVPAIVWGVMVDVASPPSPGETRHQEAPEPLPLDDPKTFADVRRALQNAAIDIATRTR